MNTPLVASHPLRQALWMWPKSLNYHHNLLHFYNHYAHFRKDFELSEVPQHAALFITADKNYRLWINGRYVCRGPARGYQYSWPFDEVDAASFLQKGKNWISVEAYNSGSGSFQYRHRSAAGFLFALEAGETRIFSDKSWLMRRSPAHVMDTARLSLQLDFQEHVDGRLINRDWITSPIPPPDWEEDSVMLSSLFGTPPYEGVEPRGIPLLRERIVAPSEAISQASGSNHSGFETDKNIIWPWWNEAEKLTWQAVPTDAWSATEKEFTLKLTPPAAGQFRAVTLAFEEYAIGTLAIEVDNAAGGEILDFSFDEKLVDRHPPARPPKSGCAVALGSRYIVPIGHSQHEFFHPLSLKSLTVIARKLSQPITLKIHARTAEYPFTMKGNFQTNDGELNAIYKACRLTQQICSIDAYIDTPWREQAQWWGDARVQARNTFHLDGDARLLARGIRSIGGQKSAQGLTYGHAPTIAYSCILPDISLTWLLTFFDYYWQTKNASLLKELWTQAEEVVNYFDLPDARHSSGLLKHDRRLWLFEDWSSLWKGEVPTFLNLWYILSLEKLAVVAKAAGMKSKADKLFGKVAAQRQLVEKLLFDPTQNLFINGLDDPDNGASVHDQVLALILGICPEAHETMIQKKILPYLKGEKTGGAEPSAFWSTYVLEEMAQRGYASEVIAFIRLHWKPFLETGTTWEGFEWTTKNGGSASHGWTAHPSYHFVNILGGIRQKAVAWTEVSIAPWFDPSLDHVEASVPTPKGNLRSEWNRKGDQITLNVAIPRGIKAVVKAPGLPETRVTGKREFTFSSLGG